jgi:hypothetical protein
MPIVSNTSPILNLAIVDQLDLLRQQFGQIQIPPAVLDELKIGSSGYLVISQAYVTSGKGFSPYGENKVYPEIQFQPQTQKNRKLMKKDRVLSLFKPLLLLDGFKFSS